MRQLNWYRIGLHVIFWSVYIVLNAILTSIYDKQPLPENLPMAMFSECFSLPPKIAMVYFVFYYIIPLYLDRNKVGTLVALLVAVFFLSAVFYRLLLGLIFFPVFRPDHAFFIMNPLGWVLTFFDLFITLAAATTIKMIRVHYKSIEFEQELIREKLQSELSFLRAQTNPHFLFNTLNNLYVLARKKSDKTPDAIMMLSKIMRFVLYDCRAPRIAVAEEIKVIHDYIELEKLRYNKRLTVEYQEDMDNPHAAIAPLLLLPFVENSFKHGASGTTGDVIISIETSLKNNRLTFSVKNTLDPDAMPNGAGGIGLRNVQRQLDLLYGEHYELKTGREGDYYVAELKLELEG
ncbi:MAG: histidine kinase [Saprospiraceae bacterium]|nr:histidine kinase [Saprospiraceae bacterium]